MQDNYFFSLVNGYWSPWSTWSHCNVFCGKGVQTRSRRCDDPSPKGKHGRPCDGQNSQEKVCSFGSCEKGINNKLSEFKTSLYLRRLSFLNIPLFRTSIYLERPSISNLPLFQTSFYLKPPSISNLPPSRISLYLVNPSILYIPLFLTALHHELLNLFFYVISTFLFINHHNKFHRMFQYLTHLLQESMIVNLTMTGYVVGK